MLTTLKKSKDTLYVNIWNKMDFYPLEEECLQAMLRGTHAFMDNIPYLTIRVGRMLKVRRGGISPTLVTKPPPIKKKLCSLSSKDTQVVRLQPQMGWHRKREREKRMTGLH